MAFCQGARERSVLPPDVGKLEAMETETVEDTAPKNQKWSDRVWVFAAKNERLRSWIRVVGVIVVVIAIVICAAQGSGLTVAICIALYGCLFCLWLMLWILSYGEGNCSKLILVTEYIREGAEGFLSVQYGSILVLALVVGVAVGVTHLFREYQLDGVSKSAMALAAAANFMAGALCSAAAGYIGLWVSVRTNGRVAAAASTDFGLALRICFRGGGVAALFNISLAVLGISSLTAGFRVLFPNLRPEELASLLTGFGFGASLVAMFAQLGGGIYTKAADIGADLVGKVEVSIPEDDPRNPAVIADLVGDNVGDCAGQCADLFESIAAEIISCMILGGSLAGSADEGNFELAWRVAYFPLMVHSLDIAASSLGVSVVNLNSKRADANSDPLRAILRGYGVTLMVAVIGLVPVCWYSLDTSLAPEAWIYYYICTILGVVMAFSLVLSTQYFTDYKYPKVRSIAEASVSGAATNVITGMAVGMESCGPTTIMTVMVMVAAYFIGSYSGLGESTIAGLFGVAASCMGMLSTAGFVLSMSTFGPIADNAGGIVEMSGQSNSVRAITDRLDTVGNITKANTKGFSIGTAALACFLLFNAFKDELRLYSPIAIGAVDIGRPDVLGGSFLGAALVFVFSGLALKAVSSAAQETVQECRRQFRDNPGILLGTVKPDYQTCVAIANRSAIRHMALPGILAAGSPVVVGLAFKYFGKVVGEPLMGCYALLGFQISATVTGTMMATFLNNSGGSWDNAKKLVETGLFGGKNSDAHKASVVGDTVGDPCKDTAGPSLHVLIKLICTVTMALTPIFV